MNFARSFQKTMLASSVNSFNDIEIYYLRWKIASKYLHGLKRKARNMNFKKYFIKIVETSRSIKQARDERCKIYFEKWRISTDINIAYKREYMNAEMHHQYRLCKKSLKGLLCTSLQKTALRLRNDRQRSYQIGQYFMRWKSRFALWKDRAEIALLLSNRTVIRSKFKQLQASHRNSVKLRYIAEVNQLWVEKRKKISIFSFIRMLTKYCTRANEILNRHKVSKLFTRWKSKFDCLRCNQRLAIEFHSKSWLKVWKFMITKFHVTQTRQTKPHEGIQSREALWMLSKAQTYRNYALTASMISLWQKRFKNFISTRTPIVRPKRKPRIPTVFLNPETGYLETISNNPRLARVREYFGIYDPVHL